MRLHYIQHVPFEGPANIRSWAENQGWQILGNHITGWKSFPVRMNWTGW